MRRLVLALSLSWMGAAVLADDPSATYRLIAQPIDEPIELDGHLDEPAWHNAPAATGFVQLEPDPGEAATEHTEVRAVYTPRTLYFGVHAFDSDPGSIVAREMQRDGTLFRDDSIILLLDTFDDDRNAYFFEFSPAGARTDSLITDEGRDVNFEWDGVWNVATRITDEGWTAEVAIPFSTLRFDPAAAEWGFNVRRLIRHKNENVFWAPITLDSDLFRVSDYGALSGIEDAEQGLALNVKPFLAGGTKDVRTGSAGDEDEFDAGLDVKWGVTRGLSLDLTLNTDFAETEVDEQQVNLTRFSLFFPEKREFFLENAGIFEFGPESGGGAPLLKVFFSRRIGIDEGVEVPIDGGVRLTGRAGEWSLGVLGVATEAVDPGPDDEFDPIPSTGWGALRLKRNVGARSSVGVIVTHQNGGGESNRVYGADFDWKLSDNASLTGFATASDDTIKGRDEAFGFGASVNGEIWEWNGSVVEIGERFEPRMGFLLRRGVRQWETEFEYEPRPEMAAVRNWSFEVEAEVTTTLDGTVETSEIGIEPFGVNFDSEDRFTFFVDRTFEYLFEPFEIVPDVRIDKGEYTFYEYGVRFGTNDSRPLSVSGRFGTGGFFDGDRDSMRITLRARPNRFFRSETTWEYNDIELEGGTFDTTVLRERLGVSLSPWLRFDTLLQYNDLAELFGANVRFNWIYKPGADLFVVFNQTWDAPSLGDLTTRDRQVIVKFTYLYQR